MTKSEIISKIKNLPEDSSKNDYIELFKQLGQVGVLSIAIPPGTQIIRARLNNPQDRSFTCVHELSARKAIDVKRMGRFNLSNESVFYGVINDSSPLLSRDLIIGEGRMFSLFEITDTESGPNLRIDKVTFSKWNVLKELNLITFLDSEYFLKLETKFQELIKDYKEIFPENEWHGVLKYFSEDFAKVVTNEKEYISSASMASYINTLDSEGKIFDGILYPSVKSIQKKSEHIGLNVALFNRSLSKISLDSVVESSIYSKNNKTVFDNDKSCLIHPNQKKYTLEKVRVSEHAGKEASISKIEELESK